MQLFTVLVVVTVSIRALTQSLERRDIRYMHNVCASDARDINMKYVFDAEKLE